MNGVGIEVWPVGAKYSGQFKRGKNHGYGMLKSKYGCTFYGEWIENTANGEGVLIDKHGATIIEGIFENDVIKYQDGKTLLIMQ